MLFPRAEQWISLALFILSTAGSPLAKRASTYLIGYRTVSAQQALIYQNAGGTLVWSPPRNSGQLGSGTYMSPLVGDWNGPSEEWYCAIFVDEAAWNLVNKAWVPQLDGCKPLWYSDGVPNRPGFLTNLGGPGFTVANTVLLSRASGFPDKLQLALPQELHNPGGGLSIVANCIAGKNAQGQETDAVQIFRDVYGSVDWSSWPNVKGTPQ